MVEAGEVIGTSSYPFTITSVDELVGNTGIKVGEFIEISGYIPTITSVDELVGDTGVEVGEFIEISGYIPTITSVDELVGDFAVVEAGEVIEISGYIPTITSVDELVGGMARQLIARVSSSFQNLKQFSDSMRVFFIFWCLLDASFTISYSLISKRTTDTRKRSLFMIY